MPPTGLELFKLLPRTNCRDCGEPTCLSFAMALAAGKAEPDACPHLAEEQQAQLRQALGSPGSARSATLVSPGEQLNAYFMSVGHAMANDIFQTLRREDVPLVRLLQAEYGEAESRSQRAELPHGFKGVTYHDDMLMKPEPLGSVLEAFRALSPAVMQPTPVLLVVAPEAYGTRARSWVQSLNQQYMKAGALPIVRLVICHDAESTLAFASCFDPDETAEVRKHFREGPTGRPPVADHAATVPEATFELPVTDVFFLKGRGTMATGPVVKGHLRLGEEVIIRSSDGSDRRAVCEGIESFRRSLRIARPREGEHAGLLFPHLSLDEIRRGDVILSFAPRRPLDQEEEEQDHQVRQGKCFVASACYGGPDHPDVVCLRRFRDDVLLNSALGRLFVRLYCRLSPPVARYLRRHPRLAALTRCLLLKRMAGFVRGRARTATPSWEGTKHPKNGRAH